MTTPARRYAWPPFEERNEAALVHGAYSPRRVQPLADQLSDQLVRMAPWVNSHRTDGRWAGTPAQWLEAARRFDSKWGTSSELGDAELSMFEPDHSEQVAELTGWARQHGGAAVEWADKLRATPWAWLPDGGNPLIEPKDGELPSAACTWATSSSSVS